jgi:hypothetical protein
MKRQSKPVDRETYKNFIIELESFDWDGMFVVKNSDNKEIGRFSDRADAIQFIDSRTK